MHIKEQMISYVLGMVGVLAVGEKEVLEYSECLGKGKRVDASIQNRHLCKFDNERALVL